MHVPSHIPLHLTHLVPTYHTRCQTNPCGVGDQQIRSLFICRRRDESTSDGRRCQRSACASQRPPLIGRDVRSVPSWDWDRDVPASKDPWKIGRTRATGPAIVGVRSTVRARPAARRQVQYRRGGLSTERARARSANHNNRLENGLEIICVRRARAAVSDATTMTEKQRSVLVRRRR